ncbi:hypothetical protein DESC_780274 [Desulfosarcina cetonica]|nr:hypothetical protein DESC_780274 [Desulfosarcina cetonica]
MQPANEFLIYLNKNKKAINIPGVNIAIIAALNKFEILLIVSIYR